MPEAAVTTPSDRAPSSGTSTATPFEATIIFVLAGDVTRNDSVDSARSCMSAAVFGVPSTSSNAVIPSASLQHHTAGSKLTRAINNLRMPGTGS